MHLHEERDGYLISTDPQRLDREFIYRTLHATYWASDRSREVILGALEFSLCFGVFRSDTGAQVGFARAVTDRLTFSWIADVVIDDALRGCGLGTWLVATVVGHPWIRNTNVTLGTRDAHGLYEKFGFVRVERMRRAPASASIEQNPPATPTCP